MKCLSKPTKEIIIDLLCVEVIDGKKISKKEYADRLRELRNHLCDIDSICRGEAAKEYWSINIHEQMTRDQLDTILLVLTGKKTRSMQLLNAKLNADIAGMCGKNLVVE